MGKDSARTPLGDWHAAHGGRLVDFAGWSMPLRYTSIVREHEAVRTAAGLFDVSHMGRLLIGGPDAAAFLDALVTRRVTGLRPGQIRYSMVTTTTGGILDDVLVYQRQVDAGAALQMVVNACNREKMVAWLRRHRGRWCRGGRTADAVTITDTTVATAMIAVQGPQAMGLVGPLVDANLDAMKYYTGTGTTVVGIKAFVSRTGYTGEDGCELIVPAVHAERVWRAVLDAGQPLGAVPAGLGCRDTLRMEEAMPLYGHELSEEINPVQAGLMFAVDLQDRDFPGHDAIARFQADRGQPKRIGLQLAGRRVPRQGCRILAGTEPVGAVTSGTFSPTLKQPIAMAYVRGEVATGTSEVVVDIRGRRESATVVPLPFFRRS